MSGAPEPRDEGKGRVADLAAYRKAREAAEKRRKHAARPQGHGVLGSNPRAKFILALIAAAGAAMVFWPLIRAVLR